MKALLCKLLLFWPRRPPRHEALLPEGVWSLGGGWQASLGVFGDGTKLVMHPDCATAWRLGRSKSWYARVRLRTPN